ncbi:GtrA family protein [Streptococcus sp. DD13]|uniref:GtrA family protein n=1 Tax=Streptococcus sp. DD13 TaxID=1777881 RepID=UPI000799FDC9|nr:GtrA family protein [Streptococcus sp. DD13]KXT78464.1 GtrA family protein [Streptococcus sp. DD13]
MKIWKQLIRSEAFLYLVFGVLTSVVSLLTRTLVYAYLSQALWASIIGNIVGILFAFVTNDRWVFKQTPKGWPKRLINFIGARLVTLALDSLLAYLFVDQFPGIIGQFVDQNLQLVNLIETVIAQVLIIILNYLLSKLFVFKDKRERPAS